MHSVKTNINFNFKFKTVITKKFLVYLCHLQVTFSHVSIILYVNVFIVVVVIITTFF
jgi:hypothetical protein